MGTSLGDSVEVCNKRWGEAVEVELTPFKYHIARWHHRGYKLEAEVWNQDGTDSRFGPYKKLTVKRLSVSKTAGTAK